MKQFVLTASLGLTLTSSWFRNSILQQRIGSVSRSSSKRSVPHSQLRPRDPSLQGLLHPKLEQYWGLCSEERQARQTMSMFAETDYIQTGTRYLHVRITYMRHVPHMKIACLLHVVRQMRCNASLPV
jgi:hypothetical protein